MTRENLLRALAPAAILLCAAAPLLGQDKPADKPAETPPAESAMAAVPVELELGYRWVAVSGNERLYRTQVNDLQGLLLHTLLYDQKGPVPGVDYIRIDASDVGAGPMGGLRFAMGGAQTFRLDFSWRHQDLYSALPAFANPFIDAGIVPGQHTYNRGRDIFDVNLQILPNAIVSPILGYTRNDYHGPGRTTYTLGQDEFALDEHIRATDEEYRLGVAFRAGLFEGAVTQGWRKYRENDTETLVPGGENGNNSAPVLGQPVTATGITRTTQNSADTPVTSAWVSGCLFGRVKLMGSYVYAAPDVFGGSAETDSGSFVSFQILRFFSGVVDTINPHVDGHAWRGQARAEVEILPGLSVMGGWRETSSELTGMALISTLYQNTVTFAGQSTGDILRLLQIENGIDRSDRVFDATVLGRQGPVSINAGWSQLHQDVTLNQDAAEIVVPGGQSGHFLRTVNTYGGGATFAMAGLTVAGDYRRDDADRPIFRTDYTDRDRFKFRASYAFKNLVKVGGSWRETKAHNNDPSMSYSADVRELVGDVEVTPMKNLTIHGSAGEFKTTRRILELAPQNFTTFTGKQDELGHTWEGGATFAMAPVTVDGSYIYLTNGGTLPFTLRRARVRSEVSMTKNLSAAFEWWQDMYREAGLPALAVYNANRYYFGLHWKP